MHEHAFSAGVIHHVFVCHPERNRDYDLITGVNDGLSEIENHVLAAHRYDAFRRLVIGSEIGFVPLADSFLQLHRSAGGCVLGEVLVERANRRLLDVVRRREVGLARAEVDYIDALRAQLLRVRRHFHGGRYADGRYPLRYFQLTCHIPFRFRNRASTVGGTSPEILPPNPKTSLTSLELI